MACGILVPQPETEPSPSAVRTQSPNHWTTSKFLLVPLVSQRYKGKKARSEGFVNCDSVPTQHGRPSDGWKVLHLLRQLCKVTLDSMWEFKSGGGDKYTLQRYSQFDVFVWLPKIRRDERRPNRRRRNELLLLGVGTRVPFSWASDKIQEQVQAAGSMASSTPVFLTLVIPHLEYSVPQGPTPPKKKRHHFFSSQNLTLYIHFEERHSEVHCGDGSWCLPFTLKQLRKNCSYVSLLYCLSTLYCLSIYPSRDKQKW